VQHLQSSFLAPVPPQIGSAQKIFVNDISENDDSADLFSAGGARLYPEITEAFRRWGRYELVDDASQADLIVEASFQVHWRCDGSGDHRFRLFVRDPGTEALLWGLTTHADVPILSRNNRKAFDAGVAELVVQFRIVAETTTWSAGASIPADPRAAASESPATAGLLSATISMPKNVVKSGSAVRVEVAVKNSLKEDLDFRYPEGDPLTCVIAVRDADGNAAPITEQGRKLKEAHGNWRGRPVAYSLLPGETQRRECTVSELDDMSRAGKYFIQVQQLDGRPAESNTLVLTVVP
jgi:hypothetical protein